MTDAPDGTVKRNPTRTVRDESIAALYEQMGERIVCADGGLRAADPSDHEAQARAVYLQGQMHGADLKLTPSDTYAVTVADRYCPTCHAPVAAGAAPILASLVEPSPLALPEFIEAVRDIQRRNTEAHWQQPAAAIVLEALLDWIGTGTTPEAITAAARHWGECLGGASDDVSR